MGKNKSPDLIKLLKEALGIKKANCSTCIHIDDVGDGVEYSSSCLVCTTNNGYGNLKSFPFKKDMKCWEPGFWHSKFQDMIKNGTDAEELAAYDSFKTAIKRIEASDNQEGF